MELNLIEEGLKFLVLGMTTVYLFLYLMVIVLKLESKIVKKYFSNPVQKPQKATVPDRSNKVSDNEDEVVAAVMAAIIEHRKK